MTRRTGSGHMSFIGVSTGSSSINRVFPAWADILGLPTRELVGIDLPLECPAQQYRRTVADLAADDDNRGALVTTHKLALFRAAHDMFDELDAFAVLCGEVSSISKRDGQLVGHAKDPVTAGLALDELLGPEGLAEGADALCLGAGGAGVALTYHLGRQPHRPRRIVCTDTDADRLDHLRHVHTSAGLTEGIEYVHATDHRDNDACLERLAPGSLVVNATGLGKDRDGSPLGDDARFPDGAIAWDFNYRGRLRFLTQAERQTDRGVRAGDGWRYFVHGWTQVVAEVFHLDLSPSDVNRLGQAAAAVR